MTFSLSVATCNEILSFLASEINIIKNISGHKWIFPHSNLKFHFFSHSLVSFVVASRCGRYQLKYKLRMIDNEAIVVFTFIILSFSTAD